ncbi:MAG: hypothetical protein ACUVRM_10440 [Bacillota bacterium]
MKAAASAIPVLPLYTLKRNDLPKAREVLSEAFAQDPFLHYIFGADGCDKTKAALFHGFSLNYGLKYGLVYAPGPEIEGVAIWLPAGRR